MREEDKNFLINKWRWYYFNYQDNIKLPYRFQEREFGYRNFEGKMIRHLSFSSENEFKAFLLHRIPQSIFYSVSFYEEPTLPMEEKGWKGADLVFDIDLGDIPSKCKERHDFWICIDCGEVGKLPKPKACPNCGGTNLKEQRWICDSCIAKLKKEVVKLLDILELDFGISSKNINLFFSGNLGFHISIERTEVEELTQYERSEIVDYIIGRGFKEEIFKRNMPLSEGGFRTRYFIEQENLPIVRIDPAVSLDVHRIFRLPNSLHEKSGMIKGKCHDIFECDPFNDFVVFKEEEVELWVTYFPGINMRGINHLPCKGRCRIPEYLAVYLILKGLATIKNNY